MINFNIHTNNIHFKGFTDDNHFALLLYQILKKDKDISLNFQNLYVFF